MVDSSATTGLLVASASFTSSETSRISFSPANLPKEELAFVLTKVLGEFANKPFDVPLLERMRLGHTEARPYVC